MQNESDGSSGGEQVNLGPNDHVLVRGDGRIFIARRGDVGALLGASRRPRSRLSAATALAILGALVVTAYAAYTVGKTDGRSEARLDAWERGDRPVGEACRSPLSSPITVTP